LAGVVEQTLTDIPPHRVGTVEAERISLLDLDDALAAAAGDPQHVLADLGQFAPWIGLGAVTPSVRASRRSDAQYAGGRSSAGPMAGTGRVFLPTTVAVASFWICFMVGKRQLRLGQAWPN
jgi:hypothetical protein